MSEDSRLPVVRAISGLPAISAEQYQHVGRYAGAAVMHCFEAIGGADRMKTWADQNPTDFYTKLFPKMISRSQQVDVSGTLTIDDAIDRLERQNSQLALADYTEVSDGEFYDL
jgi:hypothetical protein